MTLLFKLLIAVVLAGSYNIDIGPVSGDVFRDVALLALMLLWGAWLLRCRCYSVDSVLCSVMCSLTCSLMCSLKCSLKSQVQQAKQTL